MLCGIGEEGRHRTTLKDWAKDVEEELVEEYRENNPNLHYTKATASRTRPSLLRRTTNRRRQVLLGTTVAGISRRRVANSMKLSRAVGRYATGAKPSPPGLGKRHRGSVPTTKATAILQSAWHTITRSTLCGNDHSVLPSWKSGTFKAPTLGAHGGPSRLPGAENVTVSDNQAGCTFPVIASP